MRFFLLGRLRDVGLTQPARRAELAHEKAKELGITVLDRCLTVGRYDFCTLIEAPNIATASAFDHWYSREGLGDLEILVVHDDSAVAKVIELMGQSAPDGAVRQPAEVEH
jgi:uncharacterized protein with GYD domain